MSEKRKPSRTNVSNIYGGTKKSGPPIRKNRKQYQDSWQASLSDQILAQSAGPTTDSMRDNWLAALKLESLQFIENQSGGRRKRMRREQLNKEAIEVTVDRLFSCLQGFAFEFNKVAVGTEL